MSKCFERKFSIFKTPLANQAIISKVLTVVVFVGLPARGKTYTSKKLARYLNWIGVVTKCFNVGEIRRTTMGSYSSQDFFDPNNKEAILIRESCAKKAVDDLAKWLNDEGEVAVLDATNTTRERRNWLHNICKENGFQLLFIELVCDDINMIHDSVLEVKLSNPDYKGVDPELAVEDFYRRIKHYENIYEPLSVEHDHELSFIRVYNHGTNYVINRLSSVVQSRIAFYLMNLKVFKRRLFLTRHGETEANLENLMSSDSSLTENGNLFGQKLNEFIKSMGLENLHVCTSHSDCSLETARYIKSNNKSHWMAMNNIDKGKFEDLDFDQFKNEYPDEYRARQKDKFHYRFPSGESYQDVVSRLESVLMHLGQFTEVLVISHQPVLRCIYGYFCDISLEDIPYIDIPLHQVLELRPTAYGCDLVKHDLGVPAVNTYIPKDETIPSFTEHSTRLLRDRKLQIVSQFSSDQNSV